MATTIRRSNGIIIRHFPAFQPLGTDISGSLQSALIELNRMGRSYRPATLDWTTSIHLRNEPRRLAAAATPQLLRVIAGTGGMLSDGLNDPLDYGYWVLVPQGVQYALFGTVISGLNFRVAILPLQ